MADSAIVAAIMAALHARFSAVPTTDTNGGLSALFDTYAQYLINPLASAPSNNVTYTIPNEKGVRMVYIPAAYLVASAGGPFTLTITTGSGTTVVVPIAAKGIGVTVDTNMLFNIYVDSSGNVTANMWQIEGTWTPQLTFGGGETGIAYATRAGKFTRTNKECWADYVVGLTSKGSSTGSASVARLPYPNMAIASPDYYRSVAIYMDHVTFVGQYAALIIPNQTYINLGQCTEAGGVSYLTNANFIDTSYVIGSIRYYTG